MKQINNTMMTFDDLQDGLLPVLQNILAERLKYSRSWNNVAIETGKNYMEICWCEAKDGSDTTETKVVKPFNVCTLVVEIKRQFLKLQNEQK